MRKLNRKGFTLVELLAVIIILAIVIGVTIPAVLNTINESKNNAMGVAVEATQRWLEDQATIYNTSTGLVDANFPTALATAGGSVTLTNAQIDATGLKVNDVGPVTATTQSNGRICVTIANVPTSSQYYNTVHFDADGSPKSTAKNKSSHCTTVG